MGIYLDRYIERMQKLAELRNSSIGLIIKYNMRYEENPQNSGLILFDKGGGLVAKLIFSLLPNIEIFRKDHPINKDLMDLGYYPLKSFKRIVI